MVRIFTTLIVFALLLGSCYGPERECSKFKNGTFSFTSTIDGEEKTTIFTRDGSMEVDYYNGKADTSYVRWVNDCEYVVKKVNPTSMAEEKSVDIKILSTTKDSYTFEYGILGDAKKLKGTAYLKK